MMKVLSWNAAETIAWEDRERPEPLPDEVLIRVEVVGICGSEIEGYLGHNSLRVPPLVMGHEFCGTVAKTGAEVTGLDIGRKAVVNPLLYCGRCDRCLKGLTQLCDHRRIIGIHRQGGFGEWVAVPRTAVVPVPDTLSSYAAALAEPLACSLRATRRALARHSLANVLVFGAGGIGLLCASVARILGAARIMVADTNDERLRMAANSGKLDATANPRREDLADKTKAVFGAKGVDVVIDAAGFQPTRESAMKLLNPGGTLMNIGLGIDSTSLPINHQIRQEIEIIASFCYTVQDFKDAVELLIAGKVTEAGWTEVRPLSEGGNAFADLVGGKVTSGKILLKAQ